MIKLRCGASFCYHSCLPHRVSEVQSVAYCLTQSALLMPMLVLDQSLPVLSLIHCLLSAFFRINRILVICLLAVRLHIISVLTLFVSLII